MSHICSIGEGNNVFYFEILTHTHTHTHYFDSNSFISAFDNKMLRTRAKKKNLTINK